MLNLQLNNKISLLEKIHSENKPVKPDVSSFLEEDFIQRLKLSQICNLVHACIVNLGWMLVM